MIGRKMSFSLVINFTEQVLGYVSLFFVARFMGPEALGILAFGMAYIAMFQPFGDLGYGTAHTKRISEGKDLGTCNGIYFTIRMILLGVMMALVLGSIVVTKYIQKKPFVSPEHEIVLYILLGYYFLSGISTMIKATFSARKEVAKVNIANLAGKVVTVAGKVLVAVTGLGVIWLAGANVAGAIILLGLTIYFFKGYPVRKPNLEYFKSYTRFAIPVIFIGFVSKYAANIDKVMIQFFWSATDVGYYAAAKQITLIFSSVTLSSAALIFPTVSYYYAKGDIESIRQLSDRAERYLSMILFPVVAFSLVFSKQVCQLLLGNKFSAVAPVIFIILIFVVYVNAITSNYASQISGTDNIKLLAKLSIFTLGLNIILNFIFIPPRLLGIPLLGMGAIGASAATLVATVMAGIIYRFFAFRITRAKTNPVLLIHLLAAVVMAGCLFLLKNWIAVVFWYHLIVVGLLGVLIFFSVLFLFKEFSRNEFKYFLKILNPLELKNYAVKEIKEGYEEKYK